MSAQRLHSPPRADEDLCPLQQVRKLAVAQLVRDHYSELWMRSLKAQQLTCDSRIGMSQLGTCMGAEEAWMLHVVLV